MPVLTTQSRNRYREAWTGEDTFATSLLLLTIDTYGTEALHWDFRTLKMEIEDDFQLVLPQPNFDRLMTAINLLRTDDFFRSLPDFIAWCNILDGDQYDPRVFDPADAQEMAWGITEAMVIAPPDEDDEEPFTDEIRAYIGAVLDEEGITHPPDILRLALRDDPAQHVSEDFTDDPEMFGAVYELEQSKTQAITDYLRARLQLLAQQLQSLPLRTGDTAGVLQRVLNNA